jgi:hypothetical protein
MAGIYYRRMKRFRQDNCREPLAILGQVQQDLKMITKSGEACA